MDIENVFKHFILPAKYFCTGQSRFVTGLLTSLLYGPLVPCAIEMPTALSGLPSFPTRIMQCLSYHWMNMKLSFQDLYFYSVLTFSKQNCVCALSSWEWTLKTPQGKEQG